MSDSAAKLSTLRQLLSDRFPQATRAASSRLPTGLSALDDVSGGLPRHALSELVCDGPSTGGHLLFGQLLATTRALPARVALIDGCDQFDPRSHAGDSLDHLLWIRCSTPEQAMPVADLLAREPNLDLVVLDLVHAPASTLRRIPATTWYRLQRATEQTDLAFLALTPMPLVPSAQLRFRLRQSHALAAQDSSRPRLVADLAPTAERVSHAAFHTG